MRAGVIVAALLSAGGALPGPFEDGQAAYERGDYAAAMNHWRPLAEQGNADAEFNLGVMYALGQGVSRDYVQAHMWIALPPPRMHWTQEIIIGLSKLAMRSPRG
jgi:hypothetical protein